MGYALPPNHPEMVSEEGIPAAAGYRVSRYFLERYYTDSYTRIELVPGWVYSCFGALAHWFEVGGRRLTHPVSAQAVKEMVRAKQRARAIVPVIWTTPTPGSNVAVE